MPWLEELVPFYNYLKKNSPWKEEDIIIEGLPVQFFLANQSEEAIREAKEIEYKEIKTKVIRTEYLFTYF